MDNVTEDKISKSAVCNDLLISSILLDDDSLDTIIQGFDSMACEIRELFNNYLSKIRKKIINEFESLEYEKLSFEQERKRMIREIECNRKAEIERVQRLRSTLEEETEIAKKLIIKEKHDNAKKLLNEKESFYKKQQELANYWQMIENKLNQERSEIEKIKDKITEINFSSRSTVEINVGGTIFEVSRSILTEGKAKGSLLDRIFSDKTLDVEIETDKNGNIFFDRDPEIFKIIINYLRDNTKCLPSPSTIQMSLDILKEFNHFGVKFYDNSLIYVFGGCNGEKILDTSELFITPIYLEDDFSEEINKNVGWSKVKTMPTPRAYGSSTNLDKSNCALFGGYNNVSKALDSLEIYDPLTDSWREGPSMLIGRRNLASITLEDGRIFAIGGFNGENIISATEFYDSRTKYWSVSPQLNIPRSSASCVKLDQFSIAIVGGTCGDKRLKSIEIFDIRRNQWELIQSKELLEVRSGSIAYTLYGKIFVWGGIDEKNDVLSSGEILNISSSPNENTSTYIKPLSKGVLDSKIHSISMGKYSAIICGGQTAEETIKTTQFYCFQDDRWDQGPDLIFPRYGHAITKLDI
ncbi:POZ+kelch domain with kelch repeats at the C-terminus [Cryptosporidium sp. chipmunk genotype I]|uniref:POZ+kelch domain with kelch repeats at the C-terminus n=1 Tax=Cryptosporidium sp. chipmunk genotype I TaxID=1280935 RepID=UPI00351A72D0|nr:POZ+kelch domain with kelch repeats at the C-terminus [Cryptosporidium sp. chipmunk genotype I]